MNAPEKQFLAAPLRGIAMLIETGQIVVTSLADKQADDGSHVFTMSYRPRMRGADGLEPHPLATADFDLPEFEDA